ncbi:hypothetical protein, partial [Cellulomonas sp. NPDC058312]|uniref:hypothetical protein n=1 Tax=Cellulomonas sp. NPDC058312 TaxID=3346441 RepID=UPI0036F05252
MSDELDLDRVEYVVRTVAARFLDPEYCDLEKVECVALVGAGTPFNTDFVMTREIRESTRQNVRQWASKMASSPRDAVPPAPAGAVVGIAREVIRRGADRAVWTAYHAAKDEILRQWMWRAAEVEMNPKILSAVMELTSRSLGEWVEGALNQVTEQIERERVEYLWQAHT